MRENRPCKVELRKVEPREGTGPRSDVRNQTSEIRRQKSDVRNKTSEMRGAQRISAFTITLSRMPNPK